MQTKAYVHLYSAGAGKPVGIVCPDARGVNYADPVPMPGIVHDPSSMRNAHLIFSCL